MSENKDLKPQGPYSSEEKKKRTVLSAEKKYQIFLESQNGNTPVGEILRREGIYSTDLAGGKRQQGLRDQPAEPEDDI